MPPCEVGHPAALATMLAVLAPLAAAQTFTTLGFTVRGRMEGGGEGSGYGGLFHGGGRIYYQTASNDIQKRIDTAGTYQDLMDGTPVPPTGTNNGASGLT